MLLRGEIIFQANQCDDVASLFEMFKCAAIGDKGINPYMRWGKAGFLELCLNEIAIDVQRKKDFGE
ncbi:MAG: hypothetical protein C4516_07340 [Oxalobacter sp.]|nr:MAG: hypothetical protein C4516_07340 [Oxalobacter sp.]